MADWPTGPAVRPFGALGSFDAAGCPAGEARLVSGLGSGGAVWPSANLAIYVPVVVEKRVTAYQMAVEVTTQSGNIDVGIYGEDGTRLVSSGTTAVAAPGVQVFDITDTALPPGCYFLAMAVDNGTAAFTRAGPAVAVLRGCGVRQQASAFVLPTTATFADAANAFLPLIAASTVATI